MPDSYTNLLYHIVFSTKDRRPIITPGKGCHPPRVLSVFADRDPWGSRPMPGSTAAQLGWVEVFMLSCAPHTVS
jgi:hypothetical protein